MFPTITFKSPLITGKSVLLMAKGSDVKLWISLQERKQMTSIHSQSPCYNSFIQIGAASIFDMQFLTAEIATPQLHIIPEQNIV